MEITIPTSLSEISLNQWMHFRSVAIQYPDDEEFLKLAMVTHFCNLTVPQVQAIPSKEFNEIANTLTTTLTQEPKFIQRFTIEGIEYGFIPNLDKMSAGEYITLVKFFDDEAMTYNVMATLFRPIIESSNGLYRIEPFEESDKHKEAMLKMPLEVALGAKVFFYRLRNELLKATKASLASKKNRTLLQEAASMNGGAGISQLIPSLQDAEYHLTTLPN